MSDLRSVLANPALSTGINLLTTARPEIGLALQVVSMLLDGWREQENINAAVVAIDALAAEHVKKLLRGGLHPAEQREIEIRLHELLTVLIKIGGL